MKQTKPWSLQFLTLPKRRPHQHPLCISCFPNPTNVTKYITVFVFTTVTKLAYLCKSQNLAFSNIFNCSLTSCFLDPNIFLGLLSSDTCNLHSPLKIRDLPHSYRLRAKEETSEVLHLEHSSVWCGNLDSAEIRSEVSGKF
jgi:hypothetical protein